MLAQGEGEQVVEGLVTGGASPGLASELGQEVEPDALLRGEELSVAVDGGEACAPCEESDANEGEQCRNGSATVTRAGIGDVAQHLTQAFDVGFFERHGALGGLEIAAGLIGGG